MHGKYALRRKKPLFLPKKTPLGAERIRYFWSRLFTDFQLGFYAD